MPLNFVRGFRRIGWVITFPIAALIILALYDQTKEFSPTDYEAVMMDVHPPKGYTLDPPPGTKQVVELSGLGRGYFRELVPGDVLGKILNDFEAKHKPPVVTGDIFDRVAAEMAAAQQNWTFTVHKRINKLKLAGLIAGSIVIPALIIQGFISVLAWIARGFKSERA